MRKIDVFTHILPEPYVTRMNEVAPGFKDTGKRMRGVPMLVDLDVRFKVMDTFEGYQQILSICHAADRGLRQSGRCGRSRAPRQRRHGGPGAALPGSLSGLHRVAAAEQSRRARCRRSSGRLAISARAASRSFRTSPASRSTRRSSCRCSTPWPGTTCRSGCIRIAAPSSPTTRRRTVRSTRSGGRSAGPTTPARRWRGWSSPACSIDCPRSRSSRTTSARWRRTSRAASGPGWTNSAPARRIRTTRWC